MASGDARLDPAAGCDICWVPSKWRPKCVGAYSYWANMGRCFCNYSTSACGSLTGVGPACDAPSTLRLEGPPKCPTGYELGQTKVTTCFPKCMNGYNGDEVCWEQTCPGTAPLSCFNYLCSSTGSCPLATNSIII